MHMRKLMNRLLKKLILCLAVTVLFAGAMATMAMYGITGTVSAYGASGTSYQAETADEEITTETVIEEARTKSGTVIEEKKTTKTTEEKELDEFIATSKGKLTLHAVRLIFCAVVLGAVLIVFWILKRFFKKYKNPTDPNLKSKSTVMMIVYSVVRFIVVVIAILVVLSVFGVDVSGAIAGLGIAGAAGALAVQDLLKDVIMGVTLVSDRYFQMGDIVEYNGFIGKVLEISMRTTKIEALSDKCVMSIRNSNITEAKKLIHWVNMSVPLPFDLPVKRAYDVLGKIAGKCKELEPVEDAIVKGPNFFRESYIDYLIVIICDPADQLNTKRAVNTVILQVLEEEHISIPFPQTDVHIKES